MKLPRFLLTVVVWTISVTSASAQNFDEWADQIVTAIQRKQAFPAIAAENRAATEMLGYRVQKAVVKKLVDAGDEVVGHKAGLTSVGAQSRFGLLEPVAGELLKSHIKNTATFVSLRQFKGLVIEMEVGFELKLTIRDEPTDVEDLKRYVRQVVPIVELPNIYFAPEGQMTGVDIIASNVAAATVVKGRPKPLSLVNLDRLDVTLSRNNEVVSEGKGTDAMGDQWEALLWLVRQRLREGFEVNRNDLLITGALGTVIPGEAGRYVADFGKLGRVTFSLR
ncbi:2-keto-4-pentenoate hydratase [Synoicihabitans lomoniglobus]|uniref:4-oxalocrotonate decarboxylase n=1 Tax=Synoicihabitans lomoniglobus TaxID=2909285 RepID=A0AAF0CSJ7_9BACT|nr:hypothetical protein [Opitutaceae bacterium LMO-M01]WED67249.1 hypothetical protein PXH66_10345 [Opitutaceae bacterium LMO-M01]